MQHLLQMYSVVDFFNDKSVTVVAEAWFYNAGSVLWPKKHRQRSILLENNQRPPDGTKAYAVKVLRSGLTLQKARQAARRAENTDNLSSSEPRQLGRGKRIRHIRKLSSDSDDEDSPNQPTEPTGWPAPPPILQRSTTISSYVSTATIPTEFSQQVQKDMADIKSQLVNTNVRLAALEKRNDFLAEQLMALHSSVQQMQATLSDVVNALQRASTAGSVTSSSLNLPLCTEEAYENFLRRLSVEDGFANEAFSMLITEYRVILPLTVEEYQVAQLYAVAEASKEQTGGGDGVENDYMKKDFEIKIESLHSSNLNLVNAHNLPQDLLAQRKIVYVDISSKAGLGSNDCKPNEEPTTYVSVKTGRGPLPEGRWWEKEHNCPVMCAYKLVTCRFQWWGLQTQVENLIQRQENRIFTIFHRQLFCWTDRWYGLTMEDIRRLEEKTKEELEMQRRSSQVRGLKASD
ncbi:hypothetical protein SprV_0200920100 [Sparganum proliferum]